LPDRDEVVICATCGVEQSGPPEVCVMCAEEIGTGPKPGGHRRRDDPVALALTSPHRLLQPLNT